jgi:hypothetical protein
MIPDDPGELRFKYPEELQAEAQAPRLTATRRGAGGPWASAASYCSNLKNASRVRNV